MTGPVVANFSPDTSVTIESDTPLAFDVTDTLEPISDFVVLVEYPTSGNNPTNWEVAYDGTDFAPAYATLSTKASISNGFHFRLRRDGGWPASPTVQTHGFDAQAAPPTFVYATSSSPATITTDMGINVVVIADATAGNVSVGVPSSPLAATAITLIAKNVGAHKVTVSGASLAVPGMPAGQYASSVDVTVPGTVNWLWDNSNAQFDFAN